MTFLTSRWSWRKGNEHGIHAIVKRRGEWWIGWIQEIPGVTCQERTREELMDTLAVTLGEMLEIRREGGPIGGGDGYETAKISVA